MQNRSKEGESSFVEKYITMMIILKKYGQMSKITCSFLLIIPYFQLAILTLEQKLTSKQKADSIHYQILRNLVRPDIWLIESKTMDWSLLFLVVLVIFIIQKLKFAIISVLYYYFFNQDKLIIYLENSLVFKVSIVILSIYQQIISIILHQWFTLLCCKSIQQSMNIIAQNNAFINYLRIFFAFLTLILFITDSLLHIKIIEKPVTAKILGLERKQVNGLRFLAFFLEFSVQLIYVFQQNAEITIHILITLNFLIIISNLLDQFQNQIYINQFIVCGFIYGISFSLAFNSLIEIVQLQDGFSSMLTFQSLILIPIIYQILYNIFRYQERKNLISLFSQTLSQPKKLIHQLICIVNENSFEYCYIQRALIQQRHNKTCTNVSCTVCGHIFILDPNSAQGITINVYKEFIYSTLFFVLQETFKSNFSDQKVYKAQKHRLLIYVYLLYDFGWIMQSLQYFHQLLNSQQKGPVQKKTTGLMLGTLPQANSLSDRNSHFVSDNQTNISIQPQSEVNLQGQINILLNQIKFSLLERVSMKITLQNARRILKKNFGTDDSVQQHSISSEFVSFYLMNEVQVSQSIKIITDLCKMKITFYETLIKSNQDESRFKFQQNQQQFKLLYQICSKLFFSENLILLMYQQSPSFLLNQAISIYFGWILNDYQKAIQFSQSQKFLQEKLLKFEKIKNFNPNSKQIYYLIINLQEDMQHLNIHTYSTNCLESFGIQKIKGERYSFEDILPSFLQPYHHLFVRYFLEAGVCKYYKTFETNFIMGKDQLIETVNMNIDNTELFLQDHLTFAVFLQPPSEEKIFIIADGDQRCLFTKSLLLSLGWTSQQITLFTSTYDLSKIKIENIIPDFTDILESLIKLKETTLSQIELIFPKPPQITKMSNFDLTPEKRERTTFFRSTTNITAKFLGDIHIIKRSVGHYIYYVIQIIFIQKQQNDESNFEIASAQKPSPYIEDGDFDSEILNLDNIQCSARMKDFQKLATDQAINMQKNTKLFSNYPKEQMIDEILSPGRICITDQRNSDHANNNEFKELLNSNKESNVQQLFYSYEANMKDSSSDDHDQVISKKQLKESKTKTINEISKESIQKKYDIIHKLLNFAKPGYVFQLLAFTYLFLISFSSMTIFIIKDLLSDLNIAIEQIEMMQLHASIMGPHDLFFSMRITITSYQILYQSKFINAAELKELTDPFYQYLQLGYQELQDNFYTQLTNPYLVSFLNDIDIEVWFMGDNSSVIYPMNVTFRDNLFIMLQYQLQQLTAYMQNKSFSGQPFQTFLLANYLLMHNTCEQLTTDIKVYSTAKCDQIYIKWCIILLIFAIILIALLSIVYYYQKRFCNQYDMLIKILKHNSNETITMEIMRYKSFLGQMSYDYAVEYRLEKDFQQIVRQQALTDNTKKKAQSYIKFNQEFSQIRFNFINGLILICMFTYGIVIFAETQHYLSKYNVTTDFFSLIQELKFRAGNGFLYREMFFRFSSYSFLTEHDKNSLYILLSRSQEVQLEFMQLILSINYGKYLITQDLIDLFEYVQTNQMCSEIDESFKPLMDRYCAFAFEGILNNGIVPALAYLHNQIETQKQINNFTKRVEMHKYELEGAQIITRTFFALSNSFRSSFIQITTNTMEEFNKLSVSFCAVTVTLLLFLILYYPSHLMQKYKILKRIVYLIPLQVFLQDEYLERYIKEILNKQL